MTARLSKITVIFASAVTIASLCVAFSLADDPSIITGSVPDWRPGLASADLSLDMPAGSDDHADILARPVFSPLRRPPEMRPPEPPPEMIETQPEEQPQPEPVAQRTPPEYFVLRGVLLEAAKQAALIQTQTHPDGIWLERGKALEGWIVTRIGKNGIDIELGGQTASLTLYVDNSSN